MAIFIVSFAAYWDLLVLASARKIWLAMPAGAEAAGAVLLAGAVVTTGAEEDGALPAGRAEVAGAADMAGAEEAAGTVIIPVCGGILATLGGEVRK